jgi:Zn-dependent protease
MPNNGKGAIHLFRVAGIDVFLHWSWFLVAVYEIQSKGTRYSSIVWNVLEYVALFVIVLLHEFGHSLACRQVGGTSDRIMLWPLGGVAYVSPPQRPGATLWSITAGPLVNVILLPVLWIAFYFARVHGWANAMPDVYQLVRAVLVIDVILLVFNLLPIYPLDGGQIFRSLLWFIFERGRSLMIVTVLSFFGVAGILVLAVWMHSVWFGAMALFMLMSCWGGLMEARAILRDAKLARRSGVACPYCHSAPRFGAHWTCVACSNRFDPFESSAVCPACSARNATTQCADCRQAAPFEDWLATDAQRAGHLQPQP